MESKIKCYKHYLQIANLGISHSALFRNKESEPICIAEKEIIDNIIFNRRMELPITS